MEAFGMRFLCADQCKSTYPFACNTCTSTCIEAALDLFRWIGKNAKKLTKTVFQQSAANLNFFPYRLHNETLDKKINLTHDCQDHDNPFGAEMSRNFTTSAFIYPKRMAVINQPLWEPVPRRSRLGHIGKREDPGDEVGGSLRSCPLPLSV